MRLKPLVFIFFIFASLITLKAQNPTTIDVNSLTDQQIELILNEVTARGLSIEQATQMARMQGATSEQIDEILKRIQERKENQDPSEIKTTTNKILKEQPLKDKQSKKSEFTPTQKEKQIFGFQFFNTENLSFEPAVNIPTPLHYIMGIGDELSISVWGASQKTYKLKVDPSGTINIPDVGSIFISGIEFIKAKELITKRLISIYQGISGPSPNTFCEIAVSNFRSIVINVIGEVKNPGTYTIPATASAFNALYLSGGPNENGSFRNIQIIRDNQIIKTIDVYAYLIDSKTSENIQLREQDIVYIPVYQKRISANGAFKRPGLFELKTNEKLSDLIRFSGGFSEDAYKSKLSIVRFTDKERKQIDVQASIFDSFLMTNGDSVVAARTLKSFQNRVSINGAVYMPGNYELIESMKLSELIKRAEGVQENYFNRGMIFRKKEDWSPEIISFNVKEVISGNTDLILLNDDQVFIQDIFKMREKRTINIYGEVQNPGEYKFADNMTLKDIVFKAGGLKESASESFIELARRHSYLESTIIQDELVKLYQFEIDRNLKIEAGRDTFKLQPFDYVYIRKAPSYNVQRTVYIDGEVKYPGAYSIQSKNERVSDLIRRAGGILPNASIKGANMKRVNIQAQKNIDILQSTIADSLLSKVETQISNSQLELRLENILNNPGTEFDYLLKDGDHLTIPEESQEVRISGEIQNPIGLAFVNGKNLRYYIDRNGGFADKANKRKVFVIYSDGTTQVTKNFIFSIYPNPEPGCQIVIPPKPEKIRIDSTGKWLSIASTLASILLVVNNLITP